MKPFLGFGYSGENWYQFPKDLDSYYDQLSGNEFKVLSYIIRKTWGFNKLKDKISYSQFLKGIVKKDGVQVFSGLNIGRATLTKILKNLEKKGFIKVVKEKGKTNNYQLSYAKNYTSTSSKTELPPDSKTEPVTSSKTELTIEDSTIKNKTIEESKDSSVKDIIDFYFNKVQEIKGFKPHIEKGKDGKITKQRLREYSFDQLKDLIVWYLESKHSERLGPSLSQCLSGIIINLWLEDTT